MADTYCSHHPGQNNRGHVARNDATNQLDVGEFIIPSSEFGTHIIGIDPSSLTL